MYTRKDLSIAIIGSGIGGLTCALALAHAGFQRIHVFEAAPELSFVGAGIQLAPNMARVLDRLGVWDEVVKNAVPIDETHIRDGPSNTELTRVDNTSTKRLYGYAQMVAHRADLIESLFSACRAHGPAIQFHFGTSVEQILSFGPAPKLRAVPLNGVPYHRQFDVIVGCDGIKSKTREQLLQHLNLSAAIEDTGYSAYRIILPRSHFEHEPSLQHLITTPRAIRWTGPDRHIIAYPISAHTLYNIVAVQPDTTFASAPSATYTTRGSKSAMLSVYADFDESIQRLLALLPDDDIVEWKLRVHAPLPTWTAGHVALLGDACHPTLPFLAQGAAQAVEDAAVLAVALAQAVDAEPAAGIEHALRAYERLRKPRAERLVEMAAENGRVLHMAAGKEREERDRAFREAREGGGGVPDKWVDRGVQDMVFAFDCVKDAMERGVGLAEERGVRVGGRPIAAGL